MAGALDDTTYFLTQKESTLKLPSRRDDCHFKKLRIGSLHFFANIMQRSQNSTASTSYLDIVKNNKFKTPNSSFYLSLFMCVRFCSMSVYNDSQRFAATRSWRFRRRKLSATTKLDAKHKCLFNH